ncbi:ABC transporter permease [Agromyces aerolatus]|uniref:ABC transporter permease n=1 Tax=Agromyces sp. LY-1074 TaxID=3074080 RepID=UPI002865841F|nr:MULTISPECIES: ABC transporter permease [unclassified Agromyces]MDR5700878.1 ABC transporter permease [Agromyces sp. LY-1074]MDR5707461.1 ABC transporter permease [Agromyces sp. LY-1358]
MTSEQTMLAVKRGPSTTGLALTRFLRQGLVPILLLAEVIFFAVAAPGFVAPSNLANILVNAADIGLVAAGVTLVVLVGGIDVSVGNMVGVVAWVAVSLTTSGMPLVVVVPAALLLGAFLGAINGWLVAIGKVPAIIATLGMAAIYRMVLFLLWDKTDLFTGPLIDWLGPLSRVGPVPNVALLTLTVFLALAWMLRYTVFGRRLYAIGNDPESARLLGVPVARTILIAYVIVGVLVALAAIVYSGRLGVIQSNAGNDLTLPAIAAVLLGGTSILGGSGGVLKTLTGLAFIVVLQNGIVLLGVPSLLSGVMVGSALIIAVATDVLTRRVLDAKRRNSL